MADDFSGITESNQESLSVMLAEILRLVRKHDALLEQFRPLIDRYQTPAGAYMAARQARRNGNRD